MSHLNRLLGGGSLMEWDAVVETVTAYLFQTLHSVHRSDGFGDFIDGVENGIGEEEFP